jgi:hypothetical protein
MQASTNIGRTPQRRAGTRRLLAVSAALVMALAALLLTLALSSTIGPSNAAVQDKQPSNAAVQGKMPYTFFLTRYELLGDPNNPSGVRYHNNGKPFAKAPDGSKVILSGKGAWNPKKDTAEGGGHYTIKDASGAIRAQGSWRVTDFSSFEYFSGWWGLGDDFKEKGWQGPPGSASFSGFLTLKVNLAGQGKGTLVAWCLMTEPLERNPHLVNPDGHVSDGISLTGGKFNFKNFKPNERGGPPYDGLMFYSTDPESDWGYVLTPDGHTVPKKSAADDD